MLRRIAEFFQRRYRVRLTYKSGAVMTIEFVKFEVSYDGGVVKSVTWKQNRYCKPQLLFIAIQDLDMVEVLR